jgi:hypothetical protein
MSCAKKARPDPLLRAASVPQLATLVKRVFAACGIRSLSQPRGISSRTESND